MLYIFSLYRARQLRISSYFCDQAWRWEPSWENAIEGIPAIQFSTDLWDYMELISCYSEKVCQDSVVSTIRAGFAIQSLVKFLTIIFLKLPNLRSIGYKPELPSI